MATCKNASENENVAMLPVARFSKLHLLWLQSCNNFLFELQVFEVVFGMGVTPDCIINKSEYLKVGLWVANTCLKRFLPLSHTCNRGRVYVTIAEMSSVWL